MQMRSTSEFFAHSYLDKHVRACAFSSPLLRNMLLGDKGGNM